MATGWGEMGRPELMQRGDGLAGMGWGPGERAVDRAQGQKWECRDIGRVKR